MPSLGRERNTQDDRLEFPCITGLDFYNNSSIPTAGSTGGGAAIATTASLSSDDFDILSNSSSSSDNDSSHQYPTVPNPSWMPESTGDAHKVLSTPTSVQPTSTSVTVQPTLVDDNDEDLLVGLPKRPSPASSLPVPTAPPAYEPSAPPAYDFSEDTSTCYPSDDVIQAVVMNDSTDEVVAATPTPAPPTPAPTYTPPTPAPAYTPPTPMHAPVAIVTPPVNYDEDGEENLADMLEAAATAASRPVVTPKQTPSQTPAVGSNHKQEVNRNSFMTARQLKSETDRQWQTTLRNKRASIDYLATSQVEI